MGSRRAILAEDDRADRAARGNTGNLVCLTLTEKIWPPAVPDPRAPWHLVSAESKRYARVAVMRLVIESIEAGMRRVGQEPPEPVS